LVFSFLEREREREREREWKEMRSSLWKPIFVFLLSNAHEGVVGCCC
jgi:hypothetical protein